MPSARRPRRSAQQKALQGAAIGLPTAQGDLQPLYAPHPGPQSRFLNSQVEEILFGGAKGGGKSLGLRAYSVAYCMTYPGALGVIFRRSYRELEDTHIHDIQTEVPPAVASYSSGSHNLLFTNGSVLFFRYCEHEEDVRTYDSAQFDFMCFDELTAFTEFQYRYLLARCRSTKPWWPGRRIRSAATPLGVGHTWVKERFVDPRPPGTVWKAPEDQGSYTRVFIPALVTDNLTLMRLHPDYVATLNGLPEEERLAAFGNWDVFSGQFFQRWRSDIHVVAPFDIPPDWDRWIGHDYGFNAPFATCWLARPPGTQSIWVYREHYGTGVTAKEQIFRAWRATEDACEKLRGVILDPSLFAAVNVKGERIRPTSDDWREQFGTTTTIYRGNNERVPGWRLLRELLDWRAGPDTRMLIPPRMFVMETCPNLARTLPLLIADKHNIEDVDTSGEDHAPDAIRYAIRHIFEGGGRRGDNQRIYLGPKGVTVGRPTRYNPADVLATIPGLIAQHMRNRV